MTLAAPYHFSKVIILLLLLNVVTEVLASSGVITKPAEVTLDGNVVGSVNVGQTVVILGKNDETRETLVSITGRGDQPLVGLIPNDAILDKSNIPTRLPGNPEDVRGRQNPAPTSAPSVEESIDPFTASKVWTAAELSEFMRDNRQRFAEVKGKKILLKGVVSEARVEGRGERLKATIGLQTPPTMPRIKVEMSPTYLLGSAFREKFSFERHSSSYTPTTNFRKTREGISAQVVWEYKETYGTSNRRSHQWEYKQESAWIPVVVVNSNTTISAVLSDNRFEIVLVDGEFSD